VNAWPWALLGVVFLGTGALAAAPQDAADSGTLADPPASSGATQPTNLDTFLFALPTTHDHVGRVIVPVKINGLGPFRFLVDTGANHSTISPGLVQTLGLKTRGEATIVLDGITGSAHVPYVAVDKLQVGDLTLQGTALPVVWAPVMAGADGILGAAGLADKTLLIDFQRNRVAIANRIDSSARTPVTRIHALRVANGLLIMEARVGGVRTEAVLDTGSERTLGNLALRNALKLRNRSGRGFVAKLTSVYGATTEVETGEIQRAPAISIDTLSITDVALVFGDFHIFKVWEMQDRPALILGMDVLGTVTSLNVDFRNRDVYVGSPQTGGGEMRDAFRNVLSDQAMKR